ncbi:MAG TPA: TIGR03086 family metal-binding protein [Streptosporangiaceae bacterium]|jgi:uncharacterized protein (TIGR03086 family)|nr:TIGR03086 family metal-binding protein [Streptosporangiaceae bacterium]
MTTADIRDLDARAVRASADVVDGIKPVDLSRPTPCSEWTLGALLAHMTVQHQGFAAASAGRGADPEVWRVGAPSPDPVADYVMAAELVIAAFAEPGVMERGFAIPEIMPGMEFPAPQAISFHFIDYVVHGWDVARALGHTYELDADLVQAAVPVAEAVPEGERRQRPGAAFRPGLTAPDVASPMDRILAMLGRDPAWTPPQ